MSPNPLAELIASLIKFPFVLVRDLGRFFSFLSRIGPHPQQRQPLGPYEKNRERAVVAAFTSVLCLYFWITGAWLFDQLPPWVPTALAVAAGASVLYLLAGFYGARNGPRDLSGVITSLAIAAGCASLMWWQWYVPARYDLLAEKANRVLPGLYSAVMIAALTRALICARLLGGAQRIIARVMRQRAMSRRPALIGSFWEQTRAAFEDGRSGRSWP